MEPLLPLFERVRADGFAIELEEGRTEAGGRSNRRKIKFSELPESDADWRRLNEGCAILLNAAQLPVEIGLPWREATPPPRRSAGYLCVQSNPCGQQPDHAPIEPRMHPVLIELISCSDSDPSGGWSRNLVAAV